MTNPTGRRPATAPQTPRAPAQARRDAQEVIASFVRRLERLAAPAPGARRRPAR